VGTIKKIIGFKLIVLGVVSAIYGFMFYNFPEIELFDFTALAIFLVVSGSVLVYYDKIKENK